MKLQLLALLLTAAVQDNDAEKLFNSMSAKIDKAKTLQIAFDVTVEAVGEREGKIKGTVLMAEGGKVRFDGRATFDDKDERMILISDGKMLRTIERNREPKDSEAKQFHPAIMTALKRVGVVVGFLILKEGRTDPAVKKVEDLFKPSDFKLGKKEKLGDKETQRLEYKVTFEADRKEITASITLWLDAKTQLPVKHVLRARVEEKTDVIISQTYTSFRLDDKIDAKLFELPK